LTATAAEFAGGGASLVIHAAGVADIAPRRELTASALDATFAAKVAGFDNLIKMWPVRDDARILLCSSVSGLWGGYGHVAYSASNRLLDVMAGRLRADGRSCTSVRWGLWPGAGIIDTTGIARVERSGLREMDPDRAVETSLCDHPGDPLVFTADFDRLAVFLGAVDTRPETAAGVATATATAASPAMFDDAAGVVWAALGAVLKVGDLTGLDVSESLIDLGVDSLLALDLRKRIKKATGQTVPLATILGGATVAELIGHLETPHASSERSSRD
jgi:mycobactin polyketide synthetase MbtD